MEATATRFANHNMRSQRLSGALWGALAGDALGVPVEFLSRESVSKNAVTGMRGFGTHDQPPGTWSDDSSLLLCTVESLTTCREFDAADLGRRFVRWKNKGHWTPRGSVFDIGVATSQAISRLAAGTRPEEAGGLDQYSNGNGSLMRILPVALWFDGKTPNALATVAQQASALTHRHPRSQMACAFYCLLVRSLLEGGSAEDALGATLGTFARIYRQSPFADELGHFGALESGDFARLPTREISSTGYVIDTLVASVWCLLTSESFEETVLKAVNLGGDTDTTGTVAGGLAGARYGMDAIPSDWKKALARHEEIESLFGEFVSRSATRHEED